MKKDNLTNNIRLGDGKWNFSGVFPRVEEPQKTEDKFTQAFHLLNQALRRAAELKKNPLAEKKSSAYYPFENTEEQQGIFTVDSQKIHLYLSPFTFIGMTSAGTPQPLAPYAKFLEEVVEMTYMCKLNGRSHYYTSAKISHGRYPEVVVPRAVSLELDLLYWGFLFQPDIKKERVLYQVVDGNFTQVIGAGFLYQNREDDIWIQEVKKMDLF